MKTLYEILEVHRNADAQQIELAYRAQLAQIDHAEAAHPTMSAAMRLHALKEAHYILSSPARRRVYDAQLQHRERAPFHQATQEKSGWRLPVLLLTAGSFYHYQQKAQETARVQLEIARAEAAARSASPVTLEGSGSERAEQFAAVQRTAPQKERF